MEFKPGGLCSYKGYITGEYMHRQRTNNSEKGEEKDTLRW